MENLGQSNNKNVSLSLIAEYGSESDSEDTQSNDNTGNDDSDTVELSEMVLKNNIINACAHGPLSEGDTDASVLRHMIIDGSDSGLVEYDVTVYRDGDSDSNSSSDDSTDSDIDSVKDIEDFSSGDELESNNRSGKLEPPKVHGELGLDDLQPIEDLAISLPSQEITKIGSITTIVDRLVIVRAYPETPLVDLDSILFLDNGAKTLGKVFDVFGSVTEPNYCVRFNSEDHIKERGVQPGMEVFIAPQTQHTKFIFLTELMKDKGSDASWLNDIEPPPSHVDFSDDEEERRASKAKKEQKQNKQESSENGENSKTPRKMLEARRNQRPSDSSSRFGASSRGRNSALPGFRRTLFHYMRPQRAFGDQEMRMPPPHPNVDFRGPIMPPPGFDPIPRYNPTTPHPYIMNRMQFINPTMQYMNPPFRQNMPYRQNIQFRENMPVFGSNLCSMAGQPPQWGPPPPPGI